MDIALPYGDRAMAWPLDDTPGDRVLELDYRPGLPDVPGAVRRALREPLAGPSLAEAIRAQDTDSALVLVSDITRAVPYHDVLPVLVAELQAAGLSPSSIAFLIAQGTHRKHTDHEIARLYGPVAAAGYTFHQHDADAGNVSLGPLHTGNELWIDERVVAAEFLVVVGMVTPHYFAGYSGSRKSILPGVAGRETIRACHARVLHPSARLANLVDNVVHHEMVEAARRVGIDFDLELVVNDQREIVGVFGGTMAAAFAAAVAACDDLYRVPVPTPADVVVVSAGGYPKDINLYQAQKAVNNAALVVAPGGTMILLAECREGVGSAPFEEWMRRASSIDELVNTPEEAIVLGGHRAVATARVMQNCEIVVVSDLPRETVEGMLFTHAASLTCQAQREDEARAYAQAKHGAGALTYVIPHGGFILPTVTGPTPP